MENDFNISGNSPGEYLVIADTTTGDLPGLYRITINGENLDNVQTVAGYKYTSAGKKH